MLELWDNDDYLGVASINVEELLSKKPSESRYMIYNEKKDNVGEVQLQIKVDLTQVIDPIMHEKDIQEAQKKADEASKENQNLSRSQKSQKSNVIIPNAAMNLGQ